MQNKILIAVDQSENAMKAVEYAAGILGKNAHVTLFHVFYKAPPEEIEKDEFLMQNHHVLFKERIDELRAWLEKKRKSIEGVLEKAKGILVAAGIDEKNIRIRIQERTESEARDILRELKEGGYGTVVVGRRGLSGARGFFSGSVSSKIVHHAENCAVWVVE